MTGDLPERLRKLAGHRRREAHARALDMGLTLATDAHLEWLGELMAHEWRCSEVRASRAESLRFIQDALSGDPEAGVVLAEPLGLLGRSSQLPDLLSKALSYAREELLSSSVCIGSRSRSSAFTLGNGDHGEEIMLGIRRHEGGLQCVVEASGGGGLMWADPASGGGPDSPYLSAGDPELWPGHADAVDES